MKTLIAVLAILLTAAGMLPAGSRMDRIYERANRLERREAPRAERRAAFQQRREAARERRRRAPRSI